jgi:PTH1 family peptidyl-tRNA hydrolase
MILLVGLGNTGEKYIHTRHNIGFMAVDTLAQPANWQINTKLEAILQTVKVADVEIMLAKPTTMMNNSGTAVGKLAQHYKIAPENIWIAYDELDLPLGRLKIATGTSDYGHNGLISISQRLGHNRFWRFKIGVDTRQHREIPGLEYVLQDFAPEEQSLLEQSLDLSQQAMRLALASGPEAAMQEYNKAALLPKN